MYKISTAMNEILFSNTRKIAIQEGSLSAPNNVALALTLNKKLEMYGLTLDASAIRMLATQTAEEMAESWADIKRIVSNVTGATDFASGELFYPNFPEEVMKQDEAVLYINSLFYYIFSQTNDELSLAIAEEIRNAVSEDKKERLPLFEKFPRELKIINRGTEQDLFNLMNARMHSLNMSETQLEELKLFSTQYVDKFDEMLAGNTPFQSKESKVKLAMILHEDNRDAELEYLLRDGVDVLRFAAMLSKKNGILHNNVELKPAEPYSAYNNENYKKQIAFKLKKSEKQLIRNLLDKCNGLYSDIWRQPVVFKSLMNRLGTTVKDGCSLRVAHAFDNLAHNIKNDEHGNPLFNINKILPAAIKMYNETGDIKALKNIAISRPGEFLRSYISIVEKTNADKRSDVIDLIKHCADSNSLPMKNLLVTREELCLKELANEQKGSETPMAKVYKHHGKYYATEAKGTILSNDEITKMKNALQDTASKMVEGYQTLGKVYIDPSLSGVKAPGREMRDASKGSVLTPYSTIDMDKNKNLLMFGIRWEMPKNKKEQDGRHIDVDLSVHMYGPNFEDKGYISYCNIQHECGVHSGDYTYVGESGSSTEAILVDKDKLKQNGIKYLVSEVYCFNIKSFRDAGNCRFIYEQKEGNFNYDALRQNDRDGYHYDGTGQIIFMGNVFEPSQLENCITLNSDSATTVPVYYNVEEDKMYWLDNGITSIQALRNTENPYIMSQIISEIEISQHNSQPDLKSLFECYAKYNGEITTEITEADTVFVRENIDREKLGINENARIVTGYDLEVISKEFSGNDDQSMIEPIVDEKQIIETKDTPEPALVKQLRYLRSKITDCPHDITQEEEINEITRD